MCVKRFLSRLLCGVLAAGLACSSSSIPLWAGEETATPQPSKIDPDTWFLDEAAQAVVGRVFGVQGQGGDIAYHAFEFHERTPRNAAVRSLLIPGWGQSFNNQGIKGAVLFSTVGSAAVASWLLYKKADESYDDYTSRGRRDDDSYDDYKRFRTQSLILGGVASVIWIATIMDAYRSAYAPLLTSNHSLELAFAPDQSLVVWKKKFD